MRIAIMQPYFLPYIGYFQLIDSVDKFVLYDDVQYTKKGWINRNKFNTYNGEWKFSIAVESHSESAKISEIRIAKEYEPTRIIARIKNDFGKNETFQSEAMELLSKVLKYEERKLFNYISNSIIEISSFLEIPTDRFIISSEIGDFSMQKGSDKVISICRALGAKTYINPISGAHLYSKELFASHGVSLNFLNPKLESSGKNVHLVSIAQELLTRKKSDVVKLLPLGSIE